MITNLQKVMKLKMILMKKFVDDQNNTEKKKHEDAIDGIPDYEDEQENENEQGEDETEIKKKQPIKKKIQPKKIKKGITKSINM